MFRTVLSKGKSFPMYVRILFIDGHRLHNLQVNLAWIERWVDLLTGIIWSWTQCYPDSDPIFLWPSQLWILSFSAYGIKMTTVPDLLSVPTIFQEKCSKSCRIHICSLELIGLYMHFWIYYLIDEKYKYVCVYIYIYIYIYSFPDSSVGEGSICNVSTFSQSGTISQTGSRPIPSNHMER